MLHKQYWVVKPNVAKAILDCETQCCKTNIWLWYPMLQKQHWATTQRCKSNIGFWNPTLQKQHWATTQRWKGSTGIQPNVAKAILGCNPTFQKQHWATTPNIAIAKATLGYKPNVAKKNWYVTTQCCTVEQPNVDTHPILQQPKDAHDRHQVQRYSTPNIVINVGLQPSIAPNNGDN